MKKTLISILLFFILIINTNASSFKCVYANFTFSYDTATGKFNQTSDSSYLILDSNLNSANFKTESGYKCLPEVYYKTSMGTGRNTVFKISALKDGMDYSFPLNEAKSEVVNDPVTPDTPQDEVLDCKYTTNEYHAVLHYNKTKKELTMENGSCTKLNSDIKAEDFETAAGKCPSAKLITTAYNNEVYCNISNDYGTGTSPEAEPDADEIETHNTSTSTFVVPAPGGGSFGKSANCLAIMGGSDGAAYKIINGAVNIIRILAPIVAIVNAMIVLMPAITAKDETGLKTATKKCVIIGVVLLIIEVFPYVVRLIGAVFGFDLSCIG